jgi:putative flippase GtrA
MGKGRSVREALVRVWDGLAHDHRTLAVQVVRYGVVGVGVTLFQLGIYNLLIGVGHRPPRLSLILATAAAMVVGYTIHSRYTFDGHGNRDSAARTTGRFVAVNMVGLAINYGWVVLCVTVLHLSPHWPSVPIFFVTPVLLFWLNRKWVFE